MAMSRRHAKPRLNPIWMPYLRDKLADWRDSHGSQSFRRTEYERELNSAWSDGDSLRHSPMWFVSRDMTALTMHSVLHEELPEARPPSSTGFILFDGGLDLADVPDAPLAHIVGMRWVVEESTDEMAEVGVDLFSDDPGVLRVMQCPLPLAPLPSSAMGARARGSEGVFSRVLQAVWALSAEPTVCTVSQPKRPTGLEPLPPRMVDEAVNHVRMVILRENIHSPRRGEDSDGASRREFSHRFIVRGFWRNQAYGKNHELRRRQWIPPFVKGPADKPLIAKETVRIWRR